MFEHLMNEVEAINKAWGYVGVFDAIVYIHTHSTEYLGTKVYAELYEFMDQGRKMFAPKEN